MRMQYSADADILTLILKEVAPMNVIAEPRGVIVSYDETGEPVCVEFLNASKRQLNPFRWNEFTDSNPNTSVVSTFR